MLYLKQIKLNFYTNPQVFNCYNKFPVQIPVKLNTGKSCISFLTLFQRCLDADPKIEGDYKIIISTNSIGVL